MLGTQQWEPGGAQDSEAMECQVCPQSTFPAASQATDTGRLLHTLPGRSHLSQSVPQVPCPLLAPLSGATLLSTAQCLALSLEWEKKRNYKKLKKPLAQRAQTLFKMTLRP